MIEVRKFAAEVFVSAEPIEDATPPMEEIIRRMEDDRRAFEALPPEEKARIFAEEGARMAEIRAAHEAERCPHCGCHPDEHNDL
jgi:hypothetical protein